MNLLINIRNSLLKTARSFTYAFKGIYLVVRFENNTRVHLFATIIALILGVLCRLSILEWALILMQIGLVWAAEIFNTALEKLVDLVSPAFNPKAGAIKDIAAGAVLVISIMALAVGVLVFGSKINMLIKF
jgi:diacylglycerol kinase (ATP)